MNRLSYLWVALVLLWFSACTRTEQSAAPEDDQTQDLPPAGTWWGKERTWTDVAGKFSVTAKLVKVTGRHPSPFVRQWKEADKVVLRLKDERLVTVPLAKLSDEDRKFVDKNESAERGAAVLLNVFPPPAVAPFNSDQANAHQKAWADKLGVPVQITNYVGMKLNLIPPGEFMMGSPRSETDRDNDEIQHLVRVTKPFYLSAYETTKEQYENVKDNPFDASVQILIKGEDKLATRVTWYEAVAFCRKLSNQEGMEYRLPTEAEWEYACRAGTTTAYSFGDDGGKLPQFALKPNAWGLFDMHGNVKEWCQDRYGNYEGLGVVGRDPTGPASGDDSRVLRARQGGAARRVFGVERSAALETAS